MGPPSDFKVFTLRNAFIHALTSINNLPRSALSAIPKTHLGVVNKCCVGKKRTGCDPFFQKQPEYKSPYHSKIDTPLRLRGQKVLPTVKKYFYKCPPYSQGSVPCLIQMCFPWEWCFRMEFQVFKLIKLYYDLRFCYINRQTFMVIVITQFLKSICASSQLLWTLLLHHQHTEGSEFHT